MSKRRSKHKDKLSRTTGFFELCLFPLVKLLSEQEDASFGCLPLFAFVLSLVSNAGMEETHSEAGAR